MPANRVDSESPPLTQWIREWTDAELTAELAATKWIREADAILVCAGAGMSATPGQNVYASEEDFKLNYPTMGQYDLRTAYECMGMGRLKNIPPTVGTAFYSQHALNMRFKFKPNDGYRALLAMCESKGPDGYFVHTSNVDGMFEKAGFDPERIYTCQGDMKYRQCPRPCCTEVWNAREMNETIVGKTDKKTMTVPQEVIAETMGCPRCGRTLLSINCRGSDKFVHTPYQAAQDRLVAWIDALKRAGKRLVVVEIGAGYNSPAVSRYPMEAIVREMRGALIRINPTAPEVPQDIEKAIGFADGWQALVELEPAVCADEWAAKGEAASAEERLIAVRRAGHRRDRLAGFNWRQMFYQLSDEARGLKVYGDGLPAGARVHN